MKINKFIRKCLISRKTKIHDFQRKFELLHKPFIDTYVYRVPISQNDQDHCKKYFFCNAKLLIENKSRDRRTNEDWKRIFIS